MLKKLLRAGGALVAGAMVWAAAAAPFVTDTWTWGT